MLPPRKSTQLLISTIRPLAVTTFLIVAGLLVTLYLTPPVRAIAPIQPAQPNSGPGQQMMENTALLSSTMSMAEMGAMMDKMMAQMESMMASMPMTSTMPMQSMMSMAEMGQMMQMMGMMHQKMGQMQMMMGAMMAGDMMGGGMMSGNMMGEGTEESASPEATRVAPAATVTIEPSATVAVTDSTKPEPTVATSGHPTVALAITPQKATAGAVTVEATPLTTDDLLDIAFAITLETHSVDLGFDLAERAALTIGKASFPATSWEPNAPSGHHVTGTLHFIIDHPAHASLAGVDEVTLNLREIDGQPVTLHFAVGEK